MSVLYLAYKSVNIFLVVFSFSFQFFHYQVLDLVDQTDTFVQIVIILSIDTEHHLFKLTIKLALLLWLFVGQSGLVFLKVWNIQPLKLCLLSNIMDNVFVNQVRLTDITIQFVSYLFINVSKIIDLLGHMIYPTPIFIIVTSKSLSIDTFII